MLYFSIFPNFKNKKGYLFYHIQTSVKVCDRFPVAGFLCMRERHCKN